MLMATLPSPKSIQTGFLRKVVIYPDHWLVVTVTALRESTSLDVVTQQPGIRWSGIELHDRKTDWIHAALNTGRKRIVRAGNNIAGERIACVLLAFYAVVSSGAGMRSQWIVSLTARSRKDHGSARQNLDRVGQRACNDGKGYDLAIALKATEEKCFVVEDRSTDRAAELVGD